MLQKPTGRSVCPWLRGLLSLGLGLVLFTGVLIQARGNARAHSLGPSIGISSPHGAMPIAPVQSPSPSAIPSPTATIPPTPTLPGATPTPTSGGSSGGSSCPSLNPSSGCTLLGIPDWVLAALGGLLILLLIILGVMRSQSSGSQS
jgi:hypothetical protein